MDALFAAPIGALLIFCLRIGDVSLATMRMIFAVKGHRTVSASIGFFEVLIWVFAAGHALQHLDSILHVVGYAGGFATGNYVGVWLEGKVAFGVSVVRAVIRVDEAEVASNGQTSGHAAARLLREAGYAVTELSGRGRESEVDILSIVAQRTKVPEVLEILKNHDPDVFVTVEEIRTTQGGFIRPGGRKMPFLTRY